MSLQSRALYGIGDVVKLSRDRVGTIKYIGNLQNKYGEWFGVELNTKNGGKNNGCVNGISYFEVFSLNHMSYIKQYLIMCFVTDDLRSKQRALLATASDFIFGQTQSSQ